MRHRDVSPDRAVGDRGATLPELVIALGLTAMAMAAIMGLISSSSGVVGDISADDPLAGVAIDWVAADLREATGLDVVASDGVDDVTRIDITTPAGTVRWGTTDGAVERTAPGAGSPQPVVDGLRTTDALRLSLRTAADGAVDPDDAAEVDDCTRFVRIQLIDRDDQVVEERTVSVRYPRWEPPTC